MSAGPEVSIIMPVRNVAASLDAALASVCSQATDASVEVIVVGWRVRETPARLAHQYYAYGRGKFTTLVRHPSSLHLRWLAPQMLVGSLPAGILLSRTTPAASCWPWSVARYLARASACGSLSRGARTRYHAPLLGNRLPGFSRDGGALPHSWVPGPTSLR